MSVVASLSSAVAWINIHGLQLIAVGMVIAFGFYCMRRSWRGMAVSGIGLIASILWRW